MSEIISPTPGRIVWFTPADHDGIGRLSGQPLAAIVAGVHSDNLVNLAVFDAHGNTQQRSNVRLVQPGETTPDGAAYASWMPYQVKAAGIELPVVDASFVPESGDAGAVVDAEVSNADLTKNAEEQHQVDPKKLGGKQAPTEEAK